VYIPRNDRLKGSIKINEYKTIVRVYEVSAVVAARNSKMLIVDFLAI
jgi:hypothetical protein